MPKTRLGKWSGGLILAFFVFLGSFFILVAVGERGGDTFFSNLKLTIPMLLAGTCGAAAFFTGLVGIIVVRERSVFAYLSTVIGFFSLFYGVGAALG